MLRRRKKNGQSLIEFIALTMFILAAFVVFQKYIVQSFSGKWKGIGDSLGQGRVYDPTQTIECAYDPQFTNSWFNRICYEDNCEDACLRSTKTEAGCTTCIGSCQISQCDD